jgi:hypothetical protein
VVIIDIFANFVNFGLDFPPKLSSYFQKSIFQLTRDHVIGPNASHQRGRERHWRNHEKLASRPPLHALVRPSFTHQQA